MGRAPASQELVLLPTRPLRTAPVVAKTLVRLSPNNVDLTPTLLSCYSKCYTVLGNLSARKMDPILVSA